MSDEDYTTRITAFLTAPAGMASAEERLAWEDFFQTHHPLILAAIRKRHTQWQDVDDLAQNVWIIVIGRLQAGTFDPARGTLSEWVAGIAGRVAACEAHRRTRRRKGRSAEDLAALLLDASAGPETELARSERRAQLQATVEKLATSLPALARRIVLMRFIGDLSVAAIAAELGLTVDWVGAIVRRARLKLTDLLRRAGLGPA